jgi:hypothetical protein
MMSGEHRLWRTADLECVMISCCAGAELQIRRVVQPPESSETDRHVLLRELYPTKSDLYERARALEAEYRDRSVNH